MAFEIVASSYQQKKLETTQLTRMLRLSGIFGVIVLYFNFVGLIDQFMARWIIEGYVTLAHVTLLGIVFTAGATIAHRSPRLSAGGKVVQGLLVGGIVTLFMVALVFFISFGVRWMFVALSPKLFKFLTVGLGIEGGVPLLIVIGPLLGALGAIFYIAPRILRKALLYGVVSVFLIGLFSELIQLMLQYEGPILTIRNWLFTWEGLRGQGAILIFILFFGGMLIWGYKGDAVREYRDGMSSGGQKGIKYLGWAIALILFLAFPFAAGSFFGQVMMYVGLYVLMGMGLNLELGLAGLLDLGFVAFFAAGAYTIALFTADNAHLILIFDRALTWWEALPLAMIVSLSLGLLFGIPVLKVRGDYLAVATMGFGEIIRVVVLSDMARPLLGGSQGLLLIPRPWIGGFELNDPIYLFYLTLVCSLVAAYFAWSLENSRLGRAWMAIREDEDVAQALGINLVNVKLLAYGLGAMFAGLAGAIFAAMLTSIFPHSFQLLISINILALIIVGGLGSLPGVVVGAAMLIGTPELLREFGEYRYLVYGAVLVIMMRVKPIGLWPSAARKREVASAEEVEAALQAELAAERQKT
jgi:branched-chain amino acid transport system permease protein